MASLDYGKVVRPSATLNNGPELPIDEFCESFSFDQVLTMALIRAHTKTNDIPTVTDDQMNLYRKASIEAAEQYTGILINGKRTVIESVKARPRRGRKLTYKHKLKYPSSDGVVYLFGGGDPTLTLRIQEAGRTIDVPILRDTIDVSNCCDPCFNGGLINSKLSAMYIAGYKNAASIPAGIIVGCLKYIAWNITHPGDEIYTVRNRKAQEASGIIGSNNIALASGALELWRQYNPEDA